MRSEKLGLQGIADLLVRSDILNTLTEVPSLQDVKEIHTPAPHLFTTPRRRCQQQQNKKTKNTTYHYVVVDIKLATLPLRANGRTVLNTGHFPSYKGQLWIYNELLAEIQGYNPHKAFLLRRRQQYVCKGLTYTHEAYDRSLGLVGR